MTIGLAIVEGQTLVRYGLRELIAQHSDIEIVAECHSAAEARRMIAATQPDVVTVDIILPDADGLRLARDFRDRHTDLGIVILTSQDEDDAYSEPWTAGCRPSSRRQLRWKRCCAGSATQPSPHRRLPHPALRWP